MIKAKKDEFVRHRSEIEQEYKRKLDALYTLYPEFKPVLDNPTLSLHGKKNLTQEINAAIEAHSGQRFTSLTVAEWLKERDPIFAADVAAFQISNTLARLESRGKFIRKSPKGVRPTVYELRSEADEQPKLRVSNDDEVPF